MKPIINKGRLEETSPHSNATHSQNDHQSLNGATSIKTIHFSIVQPICRRRPRQKWALEKSTKTSTRDRTWGPERWFVMWMGLQSQTQICTVTFNSPSIQYYRMDLFSPYIQSICSVILFHECRTGEEIELEALNNFDV